MPDPFYYPLVENEIDIRNGTGSGSSSSPTSSSPTSLFEFLTEHKVEFIAGGGTLLLCILFCLCFCCICLMCYIRLKRRHSSNIIHTFPKFRILDAPNPNFRNDDAVSPYQHERDDIPLTESTRTGTANVSTVTTPNHGTNNVITLPQPVPSTRGYTISGPEYSYADADELRLMTATGVRSGGDAESSRTPSAYSEPNEIIGKYGSIATTPPLSPVCSPQRKEMSESSPPAYEGHYMTPAADTESLYAQIKSLKVRQLNKADITTQETLGTGNFGVVLKGLWSTESGLEPVAVKTLKANTTSTIIKFLQEAAIMGQFHHNNIIKLYGVVTSGDPVMIVLELMELGDLRNYLNSIRIKDLCSDPKLPALLLSFCRQIASGMEYLSKKGFVHRDLAARNIFLRQDLICKIGDFGLARDLMDEEYYIATGGKIPIKWTAPEALTYKKYSSASDVWSFGVLVYEIWCLGQKPFQNKTNQETLRQIEDGYRLPPPPGCPRSLYELMISCWNPEASRRPSFEALHSLLLGDEMMLLQWSDSDKEAHPEAMLLGSNLKVSEGLYTDLQLTYNMS
ncbi:PREDICTED: ephrin type-A receptor 4-B-like isoform X2 [Amphimedon queenslandica]|uniref:Protein kinase domain-containing protein n=1 Tax=Amphimedon queenslandica TaxID=400682 RepID=A0AAN0JFQ0_AMPQE|nr:PREDICTED: ephrin type-A receptor 4-B-like isoform X2 [Amphimedon queenslandica]|eukprot:XP_019855617.1 PREDICTED: ephrin type-A receptor 4-B-like isoform X2 [Amphimedon queenslandica]